MLMSDFHKLSGLAKNLLCEEECRQSLDAANWTIYLDNNETESLIGYKNGDEPLVKNDYFPNPFDESQIFKVKQVDHDSEQVIVELLDARKIHL